MSRFEHLYRDQFSFVWAAARRCGAPPDAVDDVVQEVFVTAYRRLDQLDYETSPRGWLFGVTKRVAFRHRRSAARRLRRHRAVMTIALRETHPHRRRDAATELDALLAQVDPTFRETYVMADILGMSGPEIAAETCTPLNTVYSRLRAARRQLIALAGSEARLDHHMAATREDGVPATDQPDRTWAALLPFVGATGTAVGPAAAMASAIAIPMAVLVIALVVIARPAAEGPAPPVENPVAREDPPRTARDEPLSVEFEGSTEVLQTPATTIQAPRPPIETRASVATSERRVAPSPWPTDSLAEEVALIGRGKAALEAGDATEAQRWVDEHAHRFAHGQLADAREAMRFRLLCQQGRDTEARDLAVWLEREHPRSSVTQSIPKSCSTATDRRLAGERKGEVRTTP